MVQFRSRRSGRHTFRGWPGQRGAGGTCRARGQPGPGGHRPHDIPGGSDPVGADRGRHLERRVRGRELSHRSSGCGPPWRCWPKPAAMPSSDSAAAARWMSPRLSPCSATSGTDPLEHLEVIGAGRPIDSAGPALRRGAHHRGDRFGGDPQLGAVRRRSQGEPAEPADAAEGGRGRPGSAGRPAQRRPSRPAAWMRSPSSSSRCCRGAPTRSPMRWPGTGSAAPPDHCAGRTRREWRTRGYAKILRWPACSAECAWPTPGWARSMALAAAAGARLSAPHGAVCAAVLAAAMEVNLRALRERAPDASCAASG